MTDQEEPIHYVTPEEGALRFPHGAKLEECRYCGVLLLLPAEDEADCGRHSY